MASSCGVASRSLAVAVTLLSLLSPFAVAQPAPFLYYGAAQGVVMECGGGAATGPAASSFEYGHGGLHLGYSTLPTSQASRAYAFESQVGPGLPGIDGVAILQNGKWAVSTKDPNDVFHVVYPQESTLSGLYITGSLTLGTVVLRGTGTMHEYAILEGGGILQYPDCPVSWSFVGQLIPVGQVSPPAPPSGAWVLAQGVEVKARGPAGRGGLWRAVTPCAVGTTCFAAQGAASPDLLVRLLPLGGGRVGPAWMPLSASSFDVWSREHGQDDAHTRVWRLPTAPAVTFRPGLFDLIGHRARAADTAGPTGIEDDGQVTAAANPVPPSSTWQTTPSLPGFRFQALLAGKPLVKTRSCPAKAICLGARPLAPPDVVLRVTAKQSNGKRWAILGKFATSTAAVWIEQTSTHAVRYYELQQRVADSPLLPGLLDRVAFAP